jgi:hypothetical protein
MYARRQGTHGERESVPYDNVQARLQVTNSPKLEPSPPPLSLTQTVPIRSALSFVSGSAISANAIIMDVPNTYKELVDWPLEPMRLDPFFLEECSEQSDDSSSVPDLSCLYQKHIQQGLRLKCVRSDPTIGDRLEALVDKYIDTRQDDPSPSESFHAWAYLTAPSR